MQNILLKRLRRIEPSGNEGDMKIININYVRPFYRFKFLQKECQLIVISI